MAFIFFQSALPADLSSQESGRVVDLIIRLFQDILPLERQTMVFLVRKGAHFTEYTILGFFLVPAVKEWMSADQAQMPDIAGRTHLISWLTGTLYAVTDEIHQYFVPGRSCELRDMGIDSCGVLAGVLIAGLAMRLKERRTSDVN